MEKEFTPPRHWIGPEELNPEYWNDPKVLEKRSQEFYDKPVELIDFIDRMDTKGIARRDFLTIMGASMAMATFACARRPVNKIIPYVVKPEEITPGVSTWYASTCKECSVGCGVLVKNREGRPIKLEGNPDHPVNQGHLCARGQASLLNLYDVDRLKTPLERNRSTGSKKEIAWAEADSKIVTALQKATASGGRVRVLTSKLKSPTTLKLIDEFLSNFKDASHIEFEPLELDQIIEAQQVSYGEKALPVYSFDQADVIVSLGADFLGTWISPVEHSADWVKKRKLKSAHDAKMSKMYCFESAFSLTGANADERIPVRPGDEFKVAMAIAHQLIVREKKSSFADNSAIVSTLSSYKPESVAEEIGLTDGAGIFKEIAEKLWNARGKSLVVAGGASSQTRDALYLQLVVNLLNSALENDGRTVTGNAGSWNLPRGGYKGLIRLVQDMKAGRVDVLFVHNTNPSFTASGAGLGFNEAIRQVPVVISLADREDETAKFANFVLPDHHYLENWGDHRSASGVYSLQQPTVSPLHSTRAFQDSLIGWMKSIKSNSKIADNWYEYLKGKWKESIFKEAKASGEFEHFWEKSLESGVVQVGHSGSPGGRAFHLGALAQMSYRPLRTQNAILATYSKTSMYDGRSANNAWLQEMPDPITAVTWDNYLNISPVLAQKLSLKANDVVEIKTEHATAELPIHIQPGLHPSVVSVAVGYGRRSVGKVGNHAGVDLFPFVENSASGFVYSGQAVIIRKTQKFYQLASTQWHTVTEQRPVVNDVTLAQFKKNPHAHAHTNPELRMETVPTLWPTHDYKNYRWAMSIDLNSCTGCGACVIACQAENNIPVVGRDQVRNSRQMHWLRIDRYFSGTPDKPDVIFQPMLCQHCENAPCETVCPVLATVHDDEGLNVQVYNRCVGTRYCQNNCPYKVRKFNFFDHWKAYEGTMNLAWNPDVTVRTRGIMEKCTFCIQRITEAKDKAKDNGTVVKENNLKTACQQTCPTEAISFGNINDKSSSVSKDSADPRGFHVLEVLNTKPSITYLTKVRNKEHSGENHHG
jgi:molybdopterin-containing oxidoreductase family iron-sulfur binding subunit